MWCSTREIIADVLWFVKWYFLENEKILRGETRCQFVLWTNCKEWIPSSRNPATVHRTVAFRWFESLNHTIKRGRL